MIQEIRAYKVDPPPDVYKVCRGPTLTLTLTLALAIALALALKP